MMVPVAVAVIEDDAGRVLLSRRPDSVHQGGLWEFPGGKLNPGESLEQALHREVDEELGIRLLTHRPLIQVRHDYGDKLVMLDVHLVTRWQGMPHGREGQPLRWIEKGELGRYPMPDADRPIIRALSLPDRYLIASGEALNDPERFRHRLEGALDSGVRLVQLRPAGVAEVLWQPLLEIAQGLCGQYQARLLLNSRMYPRFPLSGDMGLHLTSLDLMGLRSAPKVSGLLAASCHNERELEQAEGIGANFAVLSPVLPTSSHPGALTLGWEGFEERVREAAIPVYALGGVGSVPPEVSWHHGAQGVAGIRGLW
ncbi:MAG: Nudix family hydrolase [Gammaproteobacteria bacterium]|nr:Nudix family hydrolase [Gammaproteobacteria bacterium]MBU1654953.1 Nudix family hydrolase [Gammaproteobacteria bacterium]MBU1961724.1 Nudix family hydrolase [Gammaproteobacteria bacterium]